MRLRLELRNIVEESWEIVQNYLHEWYFPMNVEFRYLDLSTGRAVWYGAWKVPMKFIKCQTASPLFWFCAQYRKEKYLGLTSSKTETERRDLQKDTSVLCVPKTSRVERRHHSSVGWCSSALLRSFASVFGLKLSQTLYGERWIHFMPPWHTGLDDLYLLFMMIFEIVSIP